MNCIIDVGGGNRGAFGAGVLDRCMDDDIKFDKLIGVSAGAANLITFMAGQRGRLYSFYHNYAFRKEYMSLYNLLKNGQYIDFDYIYSYLSVTENPLDFDSAINYDGELLITVTEAVSGKADYITIDKMKKGDYWALKASCSIPFVCEPCNKDGFLYFDGGVADPIPVKKAFELGCDKIVLILTKPRDFVKAGGADPRIARFVEKNYPEIASILRIRDKIYNDSVNYAKELEKEGKCLIVAPDDISGVGTLKRDKDSVDALYSRGYNSASVIKDFMVDIL